MVWSNPAHFFQKPQKEIPQRWAVVDGEPPLRSRISEIKPTKEVLVQTASDTRLLASIATQPSDTYAKVIADYTAFGTIVTPLVDHMCDMSATQ